MAKTTRNVVIAGRPFALGAKQVERALRGLLPEPIKDHFVVINSRRYPPKQVLVEVTGLDRSEFTTHHARRILSRLGFPAGRRSADRPGHSSGSKRPNRARKLTRPSAGTLEPFVGQWVATRGAEVLVAAAEPREVVGWLTQHGQSADSMFRVPADDGHASGVAPL